MPLFLIPLLLGAFVGAQLDDKLDKNQPPPAAKPSVRGAAVTVLLVSGAVLIAGAAYKKIRGAK